MGSLTDMMAEAVGMNKYFNCERMHATIQKETCVGRQTKGLRYKGQPLTLKAIPLECQGCEQGRKICEAMGVELKDNKRICKVEDCSDPAKIKEVCNRHYQQWKTGKLPGFPEFVPRGYKRKGNTGQWPLAGKTLTETGDPGTGEGPFQKINIVDSHKLPESEIVEVPFTPEDRALYDALVAQAKENRRTLEQQILFILDASEVGK